MAGIIKKKIFPVATCKCYSGNLYTEGIKERIKFCNNNFKENHSAVNVLPSMYLCWLGENTPVFQDWRSILRKYNLQKSSGMYCKKGPWIHFVCVQTHTVVFIIPECQANTFDHRVMVLLRRITNTSTGIK